MTLTIIYALLVSGLVLVHIAGVWGAVDVVMRGRTPQGATAWAIALLLVPWAALPVYLVFGERKFFGYVMARRKGNRAIHRVAAELAENVGAFAVDPAAIPPGLDALPRLAHMQMTTGNRVELLIDGEATFAAIFEAIAAAERYVLVQFYIVRDDEIGRKFKGVLLGAAARGVRVYFLFDEIGSYHLPRAYIDELRRAGCDVRAFRTKRRRQLPFRLNFRNHRKIVVADGAAAFVGGANVGDEYLGKSAWFGPWRDTHVAVRGPAVMGIQMSFLEDWYWVARQVPELAWSPRPAPGGASYALAVPSGPADEVETCDLLYTQLAHSARRRLWIASPYFVPDMRVMGALQLAALRGVDTRIMIPDRHDNILVWLSAFTYYEDALPVGIRIYRYLRGFMHQKVLLSDDTACIGTANLDNRSFRINFEISVVCVDPGFATVVAGMLERDFSRCRVVRNDEFRKLPYLRRLACRSSRLLAPVQ